MMNQSTNDALGNEVEAMKYCVSHRTSYRYSQAVAFCKNQLRMQPISGGNVICESSKVTISPEPTYQDEYRDYFGNRVLAFSIESMHTQLVVEATSELEIRHNGMEKSSPSPSWESLLEGAIGETPEPPIDQHRYRSPRIEPSTTFADYAAISFQPQRPILAASLDLIKRIHADFRYDVNATTVGTTTDRAFALRAGVCQDFAHVAIACLRSLGLASRYVSGYLRTVPPPGKARLVGADESHA
ncbi:MAG: transglutaminase family protein, partial [Planctomycetota bacterium]